MFLDRDNKTKLVTASFSHFLEVLRDKSKFQLKVNRSVYIANRTY